MKSSIQRAVQSDVHIKFLDEWLIALDKPSGLLSVPGRTPDKQDCLLERTHKHFPEALVVHRLDRDTSGIMLFARKPAAQSAIARMLQEGRIQKQYVAWVEGDVESNEGTIDQPIERVPTATLPPRYQVSASGRPSITHWQVLDRREGRTRLRLSPQTGRSHQLRVHCLFLGHPMVGDPIYGHSAERLYLHAHRLCLVHPKTGKMLELEAPLPF